MFSEYLSQLNHPIITAQRLNLLSMEAALEEVVAPPELVNELREGIWDGIAHILNDDFYAGELALDQVARSINSLPLKE